MKSYSPEINLIFAETSAIMDRTITTPAMLFPAITLILLAYTNRFLAVAKRIRELKLIYKEKNQKIHFDQIRNLKRRVLMIRNMQFLGVSGLLGCMLCILFLLENQIMLGKLAFTLSLGLIIVSLWISLQEIAISVSALNIELSDLEKEDLEKLRDDEPFH